MNEWMNELASIYPLQSLAWWMNEWLNEWMNEWMNKWMNEWTNYPPSTLFRPLLGDRPVHHLSIHLSPLHHPLHPSLASQHRYGCRLCSETSRPNPRIRPISLYHQLICILHFSSRLRASSMHSPYLIPLTGQGVKWTDSRAFLLSPVFLLRPFPLPSEITSPNS